MGYRRGRETGATAAIIGLLLAAALCAGGVRAEGLYVGGALGYSKAALPDSSKECGNCTFHEMQTKAAVGTVFAGYDFGRLALEAGTGSLSHYSSHNIRTTPADIRQEIDTKMLYGRGLFFFPINEWKPFLSAGLARVSMKNHEYGRNDPSNDFVEQVNYDVRTKPIVGVGVQRTFGNVTLRAELTRVTDVAVSHWTLEQNVTTGWLGLAVSL